VIVSLRQKEYVSNLFLSKVYLKLGRKLEAYRAAEKAYKFDATKEAAQAMEDARCR